MKLKFKKCAVIFLIAWTCGFILFVVKNYMCCKNSLGKLFQKRSSQMFPDNSYLDLFLDEEKSFIDTPMVSCNATSVTHDSARQSMIKVCEAQSNLPTSLNQLTKRQQHILLSHIIVNDKYKMLYCYTPKVACSNWKKVMKQLYGNLKDKDWVRMDHAHGFTYLSDFTEQEIEKRLQTYFKFMFVRNPVERALSVYRNKFNEIESFYKVYGKKIMSMYHKDSPTYKGKVAGDDVAFEDFIRYIATGVQAEDMNEHYMPLNTLCQPCLVNYDFVGVYDNLIDDSEFVLKEIKAPDDVHFPSRQSWYKPTSDVFMHYYFSYISTPLLNDFIKKYFLDFKLFSFPLPHFVKSGSYYSNQTFCYH